MNVRKSINLALAQKDKNSLWLAERIEVSPQRLSAIKNSKSKLNMSTIEVLAKAFDMTVSEFIALGEE